MSILLAIVLAAGAMLYKNVFVTEDVSELQTVGTISPKIEENLSKISKINFDMSIFDDPKFDTFVSIESPLPSISTGRQNPFAAVVGR